MLDMTYILKTAGPQLFLGWCILCLNMSSACASNSKTWALVCCSQAPASMTEGAQPSGSQVRRSTRARSRVTSILTAPAQPATSTGASRPPQVKTISVPSQTMAPASNPTGYSAQAVLLFRILKPTCVQSAAKSKAQCMASSIT